MSETKRCSRCGEDKAIATEFRPRSSKKPDGPLAAWCNQCYREAARERQHKANPDMPYRQTPLSPEEIEQKMCSRCQQTKAAAEFGVKKLKNGATLTPWCKQCFRDNAKESKR